MADLFKTLAVALTFAVATPAFAQDAAPAATEPAEIPAGETYVAETYGAWEMQCIRTEDGFDPCQLYQLLKTEDGTPLAEISMFALPDGQAAAAGATILTPLETLLSQMLSISFNGGEARRYPFTFCNAVGCVVRAGFTKEDIQAMQTGTSAVLSLVPMVAPDQTVDSVISLEGFAEGYAAVNAANAASSAAAAAAAPATAPTDAPTPRP
ncbi:invasion associated locus B family protein [Phaeovulum sp.]|uniref:invasion associated locus B family protein n=1 Tax=Phaeovulum sp. TaxID=2934796 RepID=UPI0035621FA3